MQGYLLRAMALSVVLDNGPSPLSEEGCVFSHERFRVCRALCCPGDAMDSSARMAKPCARERDCSTMALVPPGPEDSAQCLGPRPCAVVRRRNRWPHNTRRCPRQFWPLFGRRRAGALYRLCMGSPRTSRGLHAAGDGAVKMRGRSAACLFLRSVCVKRVLATHARNICRTVMFGTTSFVVQDVRRHVVSRLQREMPVKSCLC
mmetsp:Transcript_15424/g.24664  ORF Transcript_15424/g.24664 Transcript_15424/m.24664 type:complete len:203 (+) Transcript_15424:919-1527(+)